MKNLVTGGAGFLGTHLVIRTTREGRPVRVLERPGAVVDHLPLDKIELWFSATSGIVPRCRGPPRGATPFITWPRILTCGAGIVRNSTRLNHLGNDQCDGGSCSERRPTDPPYEHGKYPFIRGLQRRFCRALEVEGEKDVIGPYCLSKLRAEQAVHRMIEKGIPIVIVTTNSTRGPG